MKPNDEEGAIFDLNLEDGDILDLIKKPYMDSEDYWEGTFGLKDVRRENLNMWLPNHWKDKDIYDYQEDYLYQDPRIFTSVETIISVVNARIPMPDVMPAQDTAISLQVAKDVGKALYAYADKYQVMELFRIQARNLLLKRIGYIKIRFDKTIGKDGEIVSETLSPEDVVIDKDAVWNDNPRFIAHKIPNKTGEELLAMFPEAKDKIYQMLGVNRTDKQGNLVAYKSQLAKKRDILEVWFQYYEGGEWKSGLSVVDDKFQFVLDKQRNPNWNYEDEEGRVGNFLDKPLPPFIPINYLNDGTSYIDLTSMVEQAAPLQRILDRRGFQIMENAEQAGSGLIFNTTMITKAEIAKLTGSPDERIGVNGDVRSAVTRVAPPPLPNYVIEDKNDARAAIDNIFATHDISRGERSKNATLGQDRMQREQDYTRMDDISRAVERSATMYYKYLVQMMKVYYTEDHYFKATGEDGQFDFIIMRGDLIEDGIDIKVEAGSTLPVNKELQMQNVQDLAKLGLIDPLSVYEVMSGGSLPSPKKMLERYMLYKTDPVAFMGKTREDDFSREAFMDIQILNAGSMPKLRDEISPEYLKFMNNYMLTGDFEKQPDLIKNLYIEFLNIATAQAQKQLEALMTQAPTQEDMELSNQKAVEQAQLEGQMMNEGPQSKVPQQGEDLANKMADQQMQQRSPAKPSLPMM